MKRLTFIPAVLALGAGISACGMSREEAEEMLKEDVVRSCHADIEYQAKYPGGVEFVRTDVDRAPNSTEEDDYRYYVNGEVDFPNGFGTPVRHTYRCYADFRDFDNPTLMGSVEER